MKPQTRRGKALVTGGGGFLGSAIVRRLQAEGWEVAIYGRSPRPNLTAAGLEVWRGEIDDRQRLAQAAAGCQAVFHTAAKAGVWGPREEYWRVNLEGTRAVVEACLSNGIQWLVHTSTPSVVFNGQPMRGASESLPYGHGWLCHYAESKAVAEQVALAADRPGGLRVCALRPHLIWGVGDPHLLPRVIEKARSGRLRIVGDGRNWVDLTHVENAALAHWLALCALQEGRGGGKAYFISDGAPVRLWEWINQLLIRLDIAPVRKTVPLWLARTIGAALEAIWRAGRLGDEPPMTRFVAVELAKDHWFNIEAARRDLGYRITINPTRGLDDFVAHSRRKCATVSQTIERAPGT